MSNKEVLVQFRATEKRKRVLKRAAEVEGLTLSEWLRRLAMQRVGELVDSPEMLEHFVSPDDGSDGYA